jgi:hypothetical protein
MDTIFIIIYGIALVGIIYYMIQLKPVHNSVHNAVTSNTTTQSAWPWSLTPYSFWPSWISSNGSTKKEEFAHVTHGNDFGHGGGYGYTGRQNHMTDCSWEGDGRGEDLIGGNFGGSGGYSFTGREPCRPCTQVSEDHTKHIKLKIDEI